MEKEKKEVIVLNTDLYNHIGTIFLIVFIIAGLYIYGEYRLGIASVSLIISGIILKFMFTAVYSICYRLDLLIDKK